MHSVHRLANRAKNSLVYAFTYLFISPAAYGASNPLVSVNERILEVLTSPSVRFPVLLVIPICVYLLFTGKIESRSAFKIIAVIIVISVTLWILDKIY